MVQPTIQSSMHSVLQLCLYFVCWLLICAGLGDVSLYLPLLEEVSCKKPTTAAPEHFPPHRKAKIAMIHTEICGPSARQGGTAKLPVLLLSGNTHIWYWLLEELKVLKLPWNHLGKSSCRLNWHGAPMRLGTQSISGAGLWSSSAHTYPCEIHKDAVEDFGPCVAG